MKINRANLSLLLLIFCFYTPNILSESDDSEEVEIITFNIKPSNSVRLNKYTYHWKVLNSSRVRLFRDGKELLSRRSAISGENVGWKHDVSNITINISKNTRYRLDAESSTGRTVSRTLNVETAGGDRRSRADREKLHSKRQRQMLRLKEEELRDIKHQLWHQKQRVEPPQKKVNLPIIHSFWSTPSSPKFGEMVTFHWNISNAQEISLYDSHGKIDFRTDGSARNGLNSWFSTSVNEDIQYKLVVRNIKGKKTSQEIQVKLADSDGFCSISGKLEGLWRRKQQDRLNGPTVDVEIPIYIRASNEKQAFAKAKISGAGSGFNFKKLTMGRYSFKNLKSGKRYILNSSWRVSPKQIEVYCKKGTSHRGPKFRILK